MWEEILEPGAQPPVDLLPFLKYVPERFASWKSLVRETRRRQRELYFGLLEECEARISSGTHDGQEAFMDEVVKRQEQLGLTREMTGWVFSAPLRTVIDHRMDSTQVPRRCVDRGWERHNVLLPSVARSRDHGLSGCAAEGARGDRQGHRLPASAERGGF